MRLVLEWPRKYFRWPSLAIRHRHMDFALCGGLEGRYCSLPPFLRLFASAVVIDTACVVLNRNVISSVRRSCSHLSANSCWWIFLFMSLSFSMVSFLWLPSLPFVTGIPGLDIVPVHPDLQNVGSDSASRITWVQHNLCVRGVDFVLLDIFANVDRFSSLDGLPFQNEEFDFVYVLWYFSICDSLFDAKCILQTYQADSTRCPRTEGWFLTHCISLAGDG